MRSPTSSASVSYVCRSSQVPPTSYLLLAIFYNLLLNAPDMSFPLSCSMSFSILDIKRLYQGDYGAPPESMVIN